MELFERLVNVVDNETNLMGASPTAKANGRLQASWAVQEVLTQLARSGEFSEEAEAHLMFLAVQIGQKSWNVVR